MLLWNPLTQAHAYGDVDMCAGQRLRSLMRLINNRYVTELMRYLHGP